MMPQIATRSATGRLVKRSSRDALKTNLSHKNASEAVTGKEDFSSLFATSTLCDQDSIVRTRRQWALWTVEEKNNFFDALFEHGKDFDAIQGILASKHKRQNVLRGLMSTDNGNSRHVKTKDQIRHYYYRTWHAISRHINSEKVEDIHKQALELFGIICYGELRKKGITKVNGRIGLQLNELVHKGTTLLKVRGKKCRIRVPNCRALKKLYSIEENKDEYKQKIPEKVIVELRARTGTAWSRVQALAQNPRLRLYMKPDKSVASILEFLDLKWQSKRQRQQTMLSKEFSENVNLCLFIPAYQDLKLPQLTSVKATVKDNFCFSSYVDNYTSSYNNRGVIRVNDSQPFIEENDGAKGISAEHKTEEIATSVQWTMPSSTVNVGSHSSISSDCIVSTSAVAYQSSSHSLYFTESRTQGSSVVYMEGFKQSLVTSNAALPLSVNDNLSDIGLHTAENLSTRKTTAPSTTNEAIECSVAQSSTELVSTDAAVLCRSHTNRSSESNVSSSALSSFQKLQIRGIPLDKELGKLVNVVDLYMLMCRPEIIVLEYDWSESCASVSIAEMMLNKKLSNRLRRLVDIISMEVIDGQRPNNSTPANLNASSCMHDKSSHSELHKLRNCSRMPLRKDHKKKMCLTQRCYKKPSSKEAEFGMETLHCNQSENLSEVRSSCTKATFQQLQENIGNSVSWFGGDMDSTLERMMTESSVEYTGAFSDLISHLTPSRLNGENL